MCKITHLFELQPVARESTITMSLALVAFRVKKSAQVAARATGVKRPKPVLTSKLLLTKLLTTLNTRKVRPFLKRTLPSLKFKRSLIPP